MKNKLCFVRINLFTGALGSGGNACVRLEKVAACGALRGVKGRLQLPEQHQQGPSHESKGAEHAQAQQNDGDAR